MKKRILGVGLFLLAAAEAGGTAYFYRRTMKRSKVKVERTMKMAGTDWNQYIPLMEKRKAAMLESRHEDIFEKADGGLLLHATWFPQNDKKKVVICFHGYTSQGMSDFIGLSDYYMRNGYSMLLVDERAHGESEGEYVGFGCKDRYDGMKWIDWVIRICGEDCRILLHGISMGGATVSMMSGLSLPGQVKGIISDCAFTSAKHVFTHVLHTMYHLPAFPMIPAADLINKKRAGYGLDECNAAREVRKAKVPILFIHGEKDTFVPCRMCYELYENCASRKMRLIVKGAAHAESYYKDTKAYEKAMDLFTGGIMK
ncbi:alpha/beta hydrolase [Sellimonas caecigallum]|uniref:Alpha/beta hydrolase n=1 Tax=Sellimonas caecigallum TaxID=2592333 RepID=A0ABS7L6F6_9FIRM|nr:alpha/beta hydrolase [Sellimonas caecigallum]MBY0758649.1 alpha/beta hydrolase [Sellimonas caecigallum]